MKYGWGSMRRGIVMSEIHFGALQWMYLLEWWIREVSLCERKSHELLGNNRLVTTLLLAGLVETKERIWNHKKHSDINRIAYYD